ncbi:MAG: hypothetical protein M3O91_01605, partial [Chloroflexota bacterium]|nr:hypothetical protein [Chloroflexota bacterium]
MVSAFSFRADVSALLARCGTVVFCAILFVPLIAERAEADAPTVRPRVAVAAADEWHLASERSVPARAGRPAFPEPASPEAPPAVPLVLAELTAPEPEAPRA